MQYALHSKFAEKNNELLLKPFQIFLSEVAGISFLEKVLQSLQ